MELNGYEHRLDVHPTDLQRLLFETQAQLAAEEMARRQPFGGLANAWLKRMRARRVCPDNERRHIGHLAELAELREGQLTKALIEEAFTKLLQPQGPLSATTVNKVRSTARMVVRDAQANGEWRGVNPFELVRPLRVPVRKYLTLTLDEVVRVLPHLTLDRRRLVKAIVLTGMRPGEALGLKKEDLDFRHKMMVVRRSHERNQTKTGRDREFPIPAALVKDLQDAVRESESDLVFPARGGGYQRSDAKLTRVLRWAMSKAGVVTAYRFSCRDPACRFREERHDGRPARCPRCRKKLWKTGLAKPLRFYDLRHTAATLMRKAGTDPLVIQLVLGHAATSTTDSTYTHLDEKYLRRELNKLKLRRTPDMANTSSA